MESKYTGNEFSKIDLTQAESNASAYKSIKGSESVPLMNYAFFSVDALAKMLEFCNANPNVKGVKFNLALVTLPSQAAQTALSLVTWAVDENGNPVPGDTPEGGTATQSSEWPCPPDCMPPQR
jgi:hypothetical protein